MEDPTFMPYNSALDIVNGSSKFNIPLFLKSDLNEKTTFHSYFPGPLIGQLLNAIMIDNLFLQNKTITIEKYYYANKTITSGKNVTQELTAGDFVVANTANVTFQAGEKISLKSGFRVERGAKFHAFIKKDELECIDNIIVSQARKQKEESEEFIQNISSNPKDSVIYRKSIDMGFVSNSSGSILYQISPNPAKENLYFNFILNSKNNKIQLKIYDLYYREVSNYSEINFPESGRYSYTYDISFLKDGIYFYQLQNNNEKNAGKFIKMR